MEKQTLASLLLKVLNNFNLQDEVFFTRKNNSYITAKRIEIFKKAILLCKYLKSLGLNANDKISIISENRVEWVITDIACILSHYISVPVYTSLSPETIKYILSDSGTVACFVSNALQLEKVLSVKKDLPLLTHIIVFTDLNRNYQDENIINLNCIFADAKSPDTEEIKNKLEISVKTINEDDIVTIIYTSGTTGIPKGVILTHKNIYSNIKDCQKVLSFDESDVFLSYLPYSHIYERTAGYYLAFFSGAKTYYAESIDTISVQMQEAKPTIVITVPRLLEKMYNRLLNNINEMPDGFKKRITLLACKIAENHGKDKNSIKWKIADKLVFQKIRERTGGRIKYFVSGGGALNKKIGEFFDGMGIITLEGYGMTETSPVISVNRPEKNKYGTVGLPLDTVKVKIADDGEILVRGDLVMKGYFNNEEETKNTIINGWLHTGDLGEIDSDGYIKITDRKKSLFKSSGGKYIAPSHIEEQIMQIPYIEQVCVIGNERMYVTALISPDFKELKSYAKKNKINTETESDMINNPDIYKLIEQDIKHSLRFLSSYEKVRKFKLLSKPFTVQDGELTPTLKVKRKFIEQKYKNIIEEMYQKI